MIQPVIPYGKQEILEEDIRAVSETLQSEFLTQGPKIKEFENNFADFVGSKYAIAVANGTATLHLSVMALGLKPNDKVITTPLTFSATANCIAYCGGEVIFSDIDPQTGLIDIPNLNNILEKETIKGIIPVSYSGLPINTELLNKQIDGKNIWVIEDACHALGAWYESSTKHRISSGSCKFNNTSVFSFHPVKHITCGEGGMIVTNDTEVFKKLSRLRTHGITKEHLTDTSCPWYYEMLDLGYNYRMTDIQAALGCSQLSRIEKNLSNRKNIAETYHEELKNLPIRLPVHTKGHAYHLYVIRTEQRKQLYHYLHSKNIKVQVHYIPVHWMPYYQRKGYKKGQFPNAEKFYSECISLPMYPSITEKELDYTIKTIKEFFK